MSRLTIHISFWTVIQDFFATLLIAKVKKTELSGCEPRGIKCTWFEGNVIKYAEPIQPISLPGTEELINRFGRGKPVKFNTITLASQARNTLKKH